MLFGGQPRIWLNTNRWPKIIKETKIKMITAVYLLFPWQQGKLNTDRYNILCIWRYVRTSAYVILRNV